MIHVIETEGEIKGFCKVGSIKDVLVITLKSSRNNYWYVEFAYPLPPSLVDAREMLKCFNQVFEKFDE